MVFKKIIFQNRYVALETPSTPPPPPPRHGKYHLKFPFWLSAHLPKKRSISSKGVSLSPIWKTKDRGQDCPAHIHVALWVPFESTKQPDWPSITTGNWITLLWITVLSSIFVIGPLNDLLERNIVAQLAPLSTGISLKLEWERVLQQ